MRRERAELIGRIDRLESIKDLELAEVYKPQMGRLIERLAVTYGMSTEEYEKKEQDRMYEDSQREWARLTAGYSKPAAI